MHICQYHFPERGLVGAEARPSMEKNKHLRKFFSAKEFGSLELAIKVANDYKEKMHLEHPEEVIFRRLRTKPNQNNRASKVSGVCKSVCRGAYYWIAGCPGGPTGDKPYWSKKFSINVLGEEVAYQSAVEFRLAWKVAQKSEAALEKFWKERGY